MAAKLQTIPQRTLKRQYYSNLQLFYAVIVFIWPRHLHCCISCNKSIVTVPSCRRIFSASTTRRTPIQCDICKLLFVRANFSLCLLRPDKHERSVFIFCNIILLHDARANRDNLFADCSTSFVDLSYNCNWRCSSSCTASLSTLLSALFLCIYECMAMWIRTLVYFASAYYLANLHLPFATPNNANIGLVWLSVEEGPNMANFT